jgi:hypothetical protein
MAMEGLLVLACAGVCLAAPEDRPSNVNAVLAVQTALQQSRDYLLHHKTRDAVEVLERQLPQANGNAAYLALLRDAYRSYIKELCLANQESAARVYQERLGILEPSTAPEKAVWSAPPAQAKYTAAAPMAIKARGSQPEETDDPFRSSPAEQKRLTRDLLAEAEKEFGKNRYSDAERLYEQAHQAELPMNDTHRERWAYCKLARIVDQLNQHSTDYPALEKEVRTVLELAPRIDFSKQLLTEIDKRRQKTTGAADEADAVVTVKHVGRNAKGWSVAETANFRVYHDLSNEWAEQTARIAERTRTAMYRKWFGQVAPAWSPKCQIFLYKTGQEYSQATGVPAGSPGHSTFQLDGGRVIDRRIDLHVDEGAILIAVLPHETTHVVLAGNFGEQPVPRWVDEGIAVLSEPRDKIERHLRNLPRHRQDGQLFGVQQLVQMNDYPEPQRIGPFYAQSVSLVEFMAREKGPTVFTRFVRDGLSGGYETALRRHYGYRGFDELERRWRDYALAGVNQPRGIAQGNP